MFSENSARGDADYNDVVVLTIYVGRRPPAGIGSGGGEKAHTLPSALSTHDRPTSLRLITREPHPAYFLQPNASQSFSPGSSLYIDFRDGVSLSDHTNHL